MKYFFILTALIVGGMMFTEGGRDQLNSLKNFVMLPFDMAEDSADQMNERNARMEAKAEDLR